MEKLQGYDEATPITGEYEKIEAGGYICEIISAKEETSQSGKKMLVIALDIADGEHKGYFKRRWEENKKRNNDPNKTVKYPSGAVYRQMLEGEKAAGFLKGLMTSLEESNSKFKWDWDEKKLKGLKCGALFGEEEYTGNDGKTKTTTKIRWIRSVQAIEDGKFEIPEKKKLATSNNSIFNDVESDDDLPF